ncbi:MAG: hypothetical protein ACRDYX_21460, partial [Egibacteraceae bacterium]
METNAGYPATMAGWLRGIAGADPSGRPGAGWSPRSWRRASGASTAGRRRPWRPCSACARTSATDLAQAFVEGHAFAVRANVEDLERVLGRPASRVVLTG